MPIDFTKKIKLWIAARTVACQDISPLFSYSMDRKLTLIEKIRVKIHLYTCSACENYISNLKFMHEVFHVQDNKIETQKAKMSLSNEAKERIKKALEVQK